MVSGVAHFTICLSCVGVCCCRVKNLALPDLSTLLWALAQLQLQPPDDVLSDLCERSAPHIPDCDVTHLTNIVWALGRLQARPGREWVEAAEAASMQVGPVNTSLA